MDTSAKQLLKERYKQLPPPIKELVSSGEFEKKFQELYKKWGVHIDVATQIENETMLVLLGLEPPHGFARNLVSKTELEPEQVGDIAMDINNTIFQPLRKTLLRMSEEGAEQESSGTSRPVKPKNVKLNVEKEEKVQQPNPTPESSPTPQEPEQKTALEPQQKSPEPQQQEGVVQKSAQPQKEEDQQSQQTPSRIEEPMRTTRKEEGGGDKDEYGTHDPYREPLNDEE